MKKKNKECPTSLFDNLDLFVESSDCRHENLAKALAAFENEDWMSGCCFAQKRT